MYIDLIVFAVLVILVIYFFRKFSSFVYLVCSIDILFRLLHFLSDNMGVEELTTLINKYIPSSVVNMASNYVGSSGIIFIIVSWAMFILYVIMLFYMIRILFKKR